MSDISGISLSFDIPGISSDWPRNLSQRLMKLISSDCDWLIRAPSSRSSLFPVRASIVDFTDAAKPVEIAYFDRGALDAKMLFLGGYWSSYWYNGYIYGSEIARGLDVFELTPTAQLTQNEIDAAKSVKVSELNVQNQQRIVWPNRLVVAKAYLDQLERSNGLSADELASIRSAITDAENSKLGKKQKGNLKKLAKTIEPKIGQTSDEANAVRLKGLADVLKQPSM